MSKWADRLAAFTGATKTGNGPVEALTKPTKAPSVSFDSARIGGFPENAMPPTAMLEDLAERAAIIGEHADTPEAWADAERDAVRLVQCRTCLHFEPDASNPNAGIGRCAADTWPQSLCPPPWLARPRHCSDWIIAERHECDGER